MSDSLSQRRRGAPDRDFSDRTPDVRVGLQRSLVADLSDDVLLLLATRRAIALRTMRLPYRLRRLLTERVS